MVWPSLCPSVRHRVCVKIKPPPDCLEQITSHFLSDHWFIWNGRTGCSHNLIRIRYLSPSMIVSWIRNDEERVFIAQGSPFLRHRRDCIRETACIHKKYCVCYQNCRDQTVKSIFIIRFSMKIWYLLTASAPVTVPYFIWILTSFIFPCIFFFFKLFILFLFCFFVFLIFFGGGRLFTVVTASWKWGLRDWKHCGSWSTRTWVAVQNVWYQRTSWRDILVPMSAILGCWLFILSYMDLICFWDYLTFPQAWGIRQDSF